MGYQERKPCDCCALPPSDCDCRCCQDPCRKFPGQGLMTVAGFSCQNPGTCTLCVCNCSALNGGFTLTSSPEAGSKCCLTQEELISIHSDCATEDPVFDQNVGFCCVREFPECEECGSGTDFCCWRCTAGPSSNGSVNMFFAGTGIAGENDCGSSSPLTNNSPPPDQCGRWNPPFDDACCKLEDVFVTWTPGPLVGACPITTCIGTGGTLPVECCQA